MRMGFKILKDAGNVPPAVELMQDIEALLHKLPLHPQSDFPTRLNPESPSSNRHSLRQLSWA